MRYRLHTLLVLLAIGPPMLAWMWFAHKVPSFPNGLYIGFQPTQTGFTTDDAGAVAVAAAIMVLVIMAAMALNRRSGQPAS